MAPIAKSAEFAIFTVRLVEVAEFIGVGDGVGVGVGVGLGVGVGDGLGVELLTGKGTPFPHTNFPFLRIHMNF